MDSFEHQRMVQDAVKKKFGSHHVLICKRQLTPPAQAEREYQRMVGQYLRLLNKLLKQYLPEMRDAAAREESNQRQDDTSDLLSIVTKMFDKMGEELKRITENFGFRHKVEQMAKLTQKLSIKEWIKAVHDTLGIDLADNYYTGELFRQLMEQWVDENVGLIVTIPQDTLGDMRRIVLEGYRNGMPTKSLVKEIQKAYNISLRHARLIARDQTAKLNSQICRKQQEDAGVTEYIWSTSEDERVRASHRRLNKKRFKWSDPPIVDEKKGRRCNPGEDYQCRCCALPVFDFDTVDLPIQGEASNMSN